MPSFYAHHRFGRLVAAGMPGNLKNIIKKHPHSFSIGLQGPDLLFYYRPLGHNKVTLTGVRMHHTKARSFFEHALKILKFSPRKQAFYAYLLGFICHFTLDSECHGYVEEYIKKSGVMHLEIEEEFEKFLLKMDHKDPIAFRLDRLIPTDKETAASIAPFYEDYAAVNKRILWEALLELRLIKRLFVAPGHIKPRLVNGCFHLTGHFAELKGLMNQKTYNPKCMESNQELYRRMKKSVPIAINLMKAFDQSLIKDQLLPLYFDRDFY